MIEVLKDIYIQAVFAFKNIPLLFWSAAFAYSCMGLVAVVPVVRTKFRAVFAPSAPATQTSIAPLDAIRGFAALWIFSYHVWLDLSPMNTRLSHFEIALQGQKAVPMFAVLSGFLIYRSLRNRRLTMGEIAYYGKRRFLRIYPLYIATFVAGTAFLMILRPDSIGDVRWFYLSDLFMVRIFGYPSFFSTPMWNAVVWTLYVEVAFYLLLPFYLLTARKRILMVSGLLFVLASGAEIPLQLPIYAYLAKYFLIGIILCEVTETEVMRSIGRLWSWLLFLSGAAFFLLASRQAPVFDMALAFIQSRIIGTPFKGQDDYSITIGIAAALLMLGAMKCMPIRTFMSLFPFRFIGIISYSIYMWHSLFLGLIRTTVKVVEHPGVGDLNGLIVLYVPAILLWSAASYALVEKPFLKLRVKRKQNA